MNFLVARFSRPAAWLVTVAVLLCAALVWQMLLGPANDAEISGRKRGSTSSASTVLPDFRIGSNSGSYEEMISRPLLNPSRRPAPLQAVAAATEPPKPQIRRGLYEMIGVLEIGDKLLAQLRELAVNRVHTVKVGELIQEFRVQKITNEMVSLEFAGETDVVRLPAFTKSTNARLTPPPSPQLQPSVSPALAQIAQAPAPTVPASASELAPSGAEKPPPPPPTVMDARQQAEFAARREEAIRAWGGKM